MNRTETPSSLADHATATVDCSVRRVRARFRNLVRGARRVRIDGTGKSDPDLLLRRYAPVCAVDLFDVTYFLSGYLYDEALGFFVGFLAPRDPQRRGHTVHARIFYKDSSLMWRVASHFVHDENHYWIGKGDIRTVSGDGAEWLSTIEETTNLPLEVQAAFDVARGARASRRDDRAIELVLRRGPSGRIEPYADFTAPRRLCSMQINRGRPIARFTRPGDPTSLAFVPGYEPDLVDGVVERSLTQSAFFGGDLHKVRVLSTNREIQYMFFASPTHAWLNPPQALTRELSTYGVRLVDVEAPDDLFVPGYEYHDEEEDGTVIDSQIPEGYAGPAHPDDPHRADASRWVESLPVIREFRKRVL